MKSPSFPAPTLPSAPVSAAIKRIASQWAPPGAFALASPMVHAMREAPDNGRDRDQVLHAGAI